MRLIIDLQGAQSASRHRGIGRYSLALAEAMVRQAGDHEVWIALNGAFPETIEPLRASFDPLLPQERIVVWDVPTPVADWKPENQWRSRTGEILREAFLASLKPDVVHVSSLFEGFGDDVVTSAGAFIDGGRTAVTLYDLIPLIHPDLFLANPNQNAWYHRKLSSLRRAGLWLAISESSRKEGIDWLGLPPDKVVNISAAANPRFQPVRLAAEEAERIRQHYGLSRPFVLYAGSTDPHKNLVGLLHAYAMLDLPIRLAHQLLIVCPAKDGDIAPLRRQAQQVGLGEDEVVFAPFVPDGDLVALYNLATAFCLPSRHEGFGLPALEAMQCGTATIGSNSSSIPEVIGRADALFDPHDPKDITARLHQVLADEDYRRSLVEHGLQQARKFSWDQSARRAWGVFEENYGRKGASERSRRRPMVSRRPRLAYLSPLPPERNRVAELTANLLPELGCHYDIDVIVEQPEVRNPWIDVNCSATSMAFFERNIHQYDRVLYQFGARDHDLRLLALLRQHPGVVSFHDFLLTDETGGDPSDDGLGARVASEIYHSYGYAALADPAHCHDRSGRAIRYPISLAAFQYAKGVIFNGTHLRRMAQAFLGERFADEWTVLPAMPGASVDEARAAARGALALDEQDFVVGVLGVTDTPGFEDRFNRLQDKLGWAKSSKCRLVVVDEAHRSGNLAEVSERGRASLSESGVPVTGAAVPAVGSGGLSALDVAVVLDDVSNDVSFMAAIECMASGVPTIVSDHEMRLGAEARGVFRLPGDFEPDDLCSAIEALRLNTRRRAQGEEARGSAKILFSRRNLASRYRDAIEDFYERGREALKAETVAAVAAVDPQHEPESEWIALARALNTNMPVQRAERQLLVDISELAQRDARTGIQRVTRSVLKELLTNPPRGFRVEPVYATPQRSGYRYARDFTTRFLNCPSLDLKDTPVEAQRGDVFLGLDLQHHVTINQKDTLAEMRRRGVEIYFVVYDLLPILLPHAFAETSADWHTRWLKTLHRWSDGLVCISRSVADELAEWLESNGEDRERPLRIGWFHLGSDIEMSAPSRGLPDHAEEVLAALSARPSFLMVGTIEPRKGHAQTVAAFEQLWASGADVNLVLVGKQGWKVEELIERLRSHPELDRRLFWLEGISDEYLEKIYAASACLIAASEGEGFGLPLIEAARHEIPILARDIPVFREVAGGHASYFSGSEAGRLAQAVQDWLTLHAKGQHPQSAELPWLTWAESADRLMSVVLQGEWYRSWPRTERIASGEWEPREELKNSAGATIHAERA